MANWPTLPAPLVGSSGEAYKPQVRTEFEGNYVQSRPKTSRSVQKHNLSYILPEATFQTFLTFFETNQGNQIDNFPEPVSGTAKSIRFSGDSLTWTHIDPNYRRVDVTVEEI